MADDHPSEPAVISLLLRTVRGLDKTGPGPRGEHLVTIWRCLTSLPAGPFHAAEVSVLRWLLKTMLGSHQKASSASSPPSADEPVLRFPLTWHIVECVFRRAPLHSLAKALADRKFVAVLRHTLDTIATTHEPSSAQAGGGRGTGPAGKRKRPASLEYDDIDGLRSPAGRMLTADAMFMALDRLVNRVEEASAGATRKFDRIGAEHVRSLLCLPAAEALKMVGPLMSLCHQSLTMRCPELFDEIDRSRWMATACVIWRLRLPGSGGGDAVEVAMHLTRTLCHLMRELGDEDGSDVTPSWSADLEQFVLVNLILPSRTEFVNHGTTHVLSTAMQVTAGQADMTGPALHRQAVRAYFRMRRGASAGDDGWIRRVFRVVEEPIRELKSAARREVAMGEIMRAVAGEDQQQQQEPPPPTAAQGRVSRAVFDTADLQMVCRQYGLGGGSETTATNWSLLRDVSVLDPMVFLVAKQGEDLLDEVWSRLTLIGPEVTADERNAAVQVIGSIIRGHGTARNLLAFLKRWYGAMGKTEFRDGQIGIWFDERIRSRCGGAAGWPCLESLETHIEPHQLVSVIDWIGKHHDHSTAAALYTVLSTVTEAVSSESYVDAIGMKAYQLTALCPAPVHSLLPDEIACLRWRIMAKTASSLSSDETGRIWDSERDLLKNVLKEQPLAHRTTFEAFRCLCNLWRSLYPDHDRASEIMALVDEALERASEGALRRRDGLLATGVPATSADWTDLASSQESDAAAVYLRWALSDPDGGVVTILAETQRTLPRFLSKLIRSHGEHDDCGMKAPVGLDLLQATWQNRASASELFLMGPYLDHALNLFDLKETWRSNRRQVLFELLALLLSAPDETWARPQRERAMKILQERVSEMETGAGLCARMLGLMIKLMGQPTFPHDMEAGDLVRVADAVSAAAAAAAAADEDRPAWEDPMVLSRLVLELAQRTFRQMVTHLDDRGARYLRQAMQLIVETEGDAEMTPAPLSYMRLRLMEAMHTTVPESAFRLIECSPPPGHTSVGDHIASEIGRVIRTGASEYVQKIHATGSTGRARAAALDTLLVTIDCGIRIRSGLCSAADSDWPVERLEMAGGEMIRSGDERGWKIRAFLTANFSARMHEPRPTQFGSQGLYGGQWSKRECIRECVDAGLEGLVAEERVQYAAGLIGDLAESTDRGAQLLAIQHAIQVLIDSDSKDNRAGENGLAGLHSLLADQLRAATCKTELGQISASMQALLRQRPGAMTQWNVDHTLGTVTVLCSDPSRRDAAVSGYPALCGLVRVILQRHRIRLEGRYHVVTAALTALLKVLLLSRPVGEANTRRFARLVTMLCEPSAGATWRGGSHHAHAHGDRHPPVLDSGADRAKRLAGQYAYVILMAYVRLVLVEGAELRPELEPGWKAVFDVTGPDTRRIMNDGLDEDGREIVREMWGQYTRFGKWRGE